MSVTIIHARGGDPSCTPGDQTGHEVDTGVWYDGKWQFVLRFKNREKASLAVRFARAAAANGHIGYGQGDRNTLRIQANVAGWDASKISRDCNCDCSSFVSVCAEAGGVNMEPAYVYGNAPWTGNMKERFPLTGEFAVLEGTEYTATGSNLTEGDILVSSGHTVIVGSAAPAANAGGKKSVYELANEVLAGAWGNGEQRRELLTAAGHDYAAVQNAVNELIRARDGAVNELPSARDGEKPVGERLTALEARVAALEKAAGNPGGDSCKIVWEDDLK